MNERSIANRLRRRLGGERATVMLEFAFMAPLVILTTAFAADFTRILRTEQQLEIATRLAADVEAHKADYYSKAATPSSEAKTVSKMYLVNVAQVATSIKKVYLKGGYDTIKNPISFAVGKVNDFMNGKAFSDSNVFLNIIGKILGGLMNFITFRTVNYVTDVIPHDKEIWISSAAYIPTVLPSSAYKWLGIAGHQQGEIGMAQMTTDLEGGNAATAWSLKLNPKKRHRVYCYMPVIDSVPLAPQTYVRIVKSWCAKQPFLKGLVN